MISSLKQLDITVLKQNIIGADAPLDWGILYVRRCVFFYKSVNKPANIILCIHKGTRNTKASRENQLICIFHFYPLMKASFWYHGSVWNVLLIHSSNNKQLDCWLPNRQVSDLIQTYQPQRCHSQNMKPRLQDSCLHFLQLVFCSLTWVLFNQKYHHKIHIISMIKEYNKK